MQLNKVQKVLVIILLIIFSPLILVGGIIYLLYNLITSPFEKGKYKKSLFYEKFKIDYKRGITKDKKYLIYNYVVSNGGEINFVDGSSLYENFNFIRIVMNDKKVLILPPFFNDYKVEEDDLLVLLPKAVDYTSLKKFFHDRFAKFKDYHKIVSIEPSANLKNFEFDRFDGKKFSLIISLTNKDYMNKVTTIINEL